MKLYTNLWIAAIAALTALGAKAQCYPLRHNTTWADSWLSCQSRVNPIQSYGSGHWVLYDFGNTYRLGNLHFWNYNVVNHGTAGFKDVAIDYSIDGHLWKHLGTFVANQSEGLSTYEGEDLAHFGGDTARYMLLTALSNYGGTCYGFSELKVEVVEPISQLYAPQLSSCMQASVYPNPHRDAFQLRVSGTCTGDFSYRLFDHTGKQVEGGFASGENDSFSQMIATSALAAGMYHLVLTYGGEVQRIPIIKLE